MKITRTINGKTIEIELTPKEIFAAYKEQEAQNRYAEVKNNMEFYLSDDEYGLLKDNAGFIKDVADDMQYNMDYGEMPFDEALWRAIGCIKEDYLE